MTISPDYQDYIDLTIYDKSPTDIVAAAQTTLQSRIPDWIPSSTNIEVMLLEALAIEVSETVFSINRVPENVLRALIALYGVVADPGAPPTVDLTFNAYDTDGYVIPAGTEVSILTSAGEYISFFTDEEATIASTTTSVTVGSTATSYTNIANGLPIGTEGELINPIEGVETVETATIVTGGDLPETIDSWTERGVQRLARLSDTLVIAKHFTQAALENPLVFRANTVDNWNSNASPPTTPGNDPGYVAVVVYGDGAALTTGQKAAINTDLSQRANANLVINVIDPTITTVNVTASVKVLAGYNQTTVLNAVKSAVEQYLNPATWAWSGSVRRNELIVVMDKVAGVDYVGTITAPSSDVTLGNGNTLAKYGTVTITAVT